MEPKLIAYTCALCEDDFSRPKQKGRKPQFCSDKCVSRANALKSRYDLSPKQYRQMVDDQGGICAVCEQQANLDVDHDHATQKVRGLLCFRCNAGLGSFKDNPEFLENAIRYLKDHADGKWPSVVAYSRMFRCVICRKNFVQRRSDKVVCSPACQTQHWRNRNRDKHRTTRRAYYERTGK